MFGKCTRKLVVRWSVFLALLVELGIGIWALAAGRMPVATVLRFGDVSSKTSHLDLFWAVPRWVDPLIMMVPLAILIWLTLEGDHIQERWRPGKTADWMDGTLMGGFWLGVLGSPTISLGGFPFLVVCTIIVSAIIAITAMANGHKMVGAFLYEFIAVLIVWVVNTICQGAISGAFYAGSALAIAAATHFGIAFLRWLAVSILQPSSNAFGRKVIKPAAVTFNRIMIDPCQDES